jgi:1-aminocyclopropane-1-carboxylate deaminase/D-cysteine desulfhydrase-like pyridoxal-dependent ACC family enzyme
MDLTAFARVPLAQLPTPIEPLARLAAEAGWPGLYVKRDDMTGLATGGNKTRKLEFALGAALAESADTVITAGGLQSNHARQTAAAAARLGLRCELVLTSNAPAADTPDYQESGNMLLDRLLGAQVEVHPAASDRPALMAARAEALTGGGRRPYIIPIGASYPTGNLGYVRAALEVTAQANDMGVHFDYLVTATSSGGTLAGLAVGFAALNYPIKIEATRELLGLDPPPAPSEIEIILGHAGGGASREGLLLDPVYSGKAMAGLIGLARAGRFQTHEKVLFLHTGGAAGLFGYRSYFT